MSSKRTRKKAKRQQLDEATDNYLIERTSADATGGDVSAKSNDQLFVIDKSTDVETYQKVRDGRLQSDRVSSAAPLRWEEAATAVTARTSRKTVPRRANRGDVLTKKKAQTMASRGALPTKELLARRRKKRRLPTAVTDDLWGNSDMVAVTSKGHGKKKGVVPQVRGVDAVQVPHSGLSYNPTFEAHQDALGEAVATEISRTEALSDAIEHLRPEPDADRIEGIMIQMDDDQSEEESGGATEQDSTPGDKKSRRPRTERVSTSQRNKRLRHKQEVEAAATLRRERQILRQVDEAKTIAKEVDQLEHGRKQKMQQKQARIKDRQKLPAFRGRFKFEDDTKVCEVPLSEELSSHLRNMQVQGNLLADRYKSMQRRAIIEPRRPHKLRRRYKLKTYSKEKGPPELRLRTAKIKDPSA